ncbi:multiple banded antigen [Ureaplasma urealyticum serovar 11 str. ATCC 33695]|nr:DUF1410 domain-containing protein [Ureaplasma urealyticum]EDU67198.1 multiple banded antigen [Ureaplasma urealyticum serovar 11 str. ATCC 33695]
MKLLKNKKFWAITLGVTLVGAGVVAVAASCSSSNVKSKLSSQLVKSKDEKSFYAVYDIENFDDLTENDKKALNETEFNVAITSVENKTENATIKGHLLNKKIYVKLPREPKAKEQLTIINKGGLLKTASLALPDNLNYQTEKVDFKSTHTPEPTPTPTPAPKEDKAVVSNVEFSDVDAKAKTAKVKLTFALVVQLKDESQKLLKLTLTKDSETKEVDLVLSEDKLSATADLSELKEGIYKVSKLTLNNVEVSLSDEIKNKELKVELTSTSQPGSSETQKLLVKSVEFNNTTTNKATIKLTFETLNLKEEDKNKFSIALQKSTDDTREENAKIEKVEFNNEQKTVELTINGLTKKTKYKLQWLSFDSNTLDISKLKNKEFETLSETNGSGSASGSGAQSGNGSGSASGSGAQSGNGSGSASGSGAQSGNGSGSASGSGAQSGNGSGSASGSGAQSGNGSGSASGSGAQSGNGSGSASGSGAQSGNGSGSASGSGAQSGNGSGSASGSGAQSGNGSGSASGSGAQSGNGSGSASGSGAQSGNGSGSASGSK